MSARRERYGWLPYAGAILPLFGFQLYAFQWGVILPDTVEQYAQALSGQYEDWHPPIMAFLWRGLGRIAPGSAPFLLFDCALYWLGVGCFAEGFRRSGRRWAGWIAIAIAATPIPFGQMGAILKDSLLAATLVAASGLLAIDLLPGRRVKLWRGVAAIALILLGAAARSNGVLAGAPLLLLAAAPGAWRRPARAIFGILVAGVALVAGSTLLNNTMLRPKHTHPLLSVFHFDVAGTSVGAGRNLYPLPQPDLALVRSCYTPAIYNPDYRDACNAPEDHFFATALHGPRGGALLWMDAIRAAPLAYLVHRARHFNAAMRWYEARVPDDAVFLMSQLNALGLAFTAVPATRAIYRAASWMAWSPLGRPATWLGVALGLLFVAPKLRSGAPVSALAASAALYALGYAVAGVAPDLRYNLWTMLAAMLALLAALADPARANAGARRWALAAIPAVLAIGGELLAITA